MNKKVTFITQAGVIAALYVVLTLLANALGLANYAIQVRFSEALTILPFFTPAAIPGLFVGCFLSNILTGCAPLDVVFGSLATLAGAVGTYLLRKYKWMAPVPPIVANIIVVPLVLAYVYRFEGSLIFFAITVGIGEIISCGVFGMALLSVLNKYARQIFKTEEGELINAVFGSGTDGRKK
ncbi:MAG: QueT transporter family protein [Lachnospiraceae bacterium]|nr:QueT transporter family protein [Lachnospiraceae bacterium]